jgi:hypothetical protein
MGVPQRILTDNRKHAEEHEVEGPDLQAEAGKIYDLSLVMMDRDMNLVLAGGKD